MTQPSKASLERARDILAARLGYEHPKPKHVTALALALDLERRRAIEECAKEAESWWEMFNFDSFATDDPRRFANPNQIAARIRALAGWED